MAPVNRQTMVVPMDLGLAANYDRAAFSFSWFKDGNSLDKAQYLLDATLEEMTGILSLGSDGRQIKELLNETKEQYDILLGRHDELQVEQEPKTRNPIKLIARHRAARLFLRETAGLYVSIRRKSNELKRTINRDLVSVAAQDVHPAGDDVPPDVNVTGIAVRLDGPVNEETARTIADAANTIASYANPFGDDLTLDRLSTDIVPSEPQPLKGNATQGLSACETSGPHLQDPSVTASRPTSPPVSEASDRSQQSSPIRPRPMSPSPSRSFEPYRRSQASLPTPRASSPSIQNFYYFDHSFVSPKSSVYGPSLVHGGSQNSGAVNHFTTLNGAPEAD